MIAILGIGKLAADRAAQDPLGCRLLEGFRGVAAADKDGLADLLVGLSGMAVAYGDLVVEMDLNPVVFSGGQWQVADASCAFVRSDPHAFTPRLRGCPGGAGRPAISAPMLGVTEPLPR